MKTSYQIPFILLIAIVLTSSFKKVNAQSSKKKSHIIIVTNENGKETKIDTSFTDESSMEAFLLEKEIAPPTPPSPPSPLNPPAPPSSPFTLNPPTPPNPPSPNSISEHKINKVYTYRYNYNDENDDQNEIIISFKEKEFNSLIDRLESTIHELEQNKSISQKDIKKELSELKSELKKIRTESKSEKKVERKIKIEKED